MTQHIRVFLSYSWESEEHPDYRHWVERLAARLRKDGVDARLDAWNRQEGVSIVQFMTAEVREADKILVLCSPGMQRKVRKTEEGEETAGVGYEIGLLLDQIFAGVKGARSKAIPVLTLGQWTDSAPDALIGQPYQDLSDPETFETGYRALLQRITGQTKKAPPIGTLPEDLRPPEAEPLRGTQPPPDSDGAADPGKCLDFRLEDDAEGGAHVELRIDGGDPVETTVKLGLDASQVAKEINSIQDGSCSRDDIQNLGAELWTRLLGGEISSSVYSARLACRENRKAVLRIRLAVSPSLECLPWEALYDFDEGSLATSAQTSLVRARFRDKGEVGAAEPLEPPATDKLKMLIVIPSGSGLRTSSEWEKIQQSLRQISRHVDFQSLDGLVTANDLAAELRKPWDIVHFIGHGHLNEEGRVEIRLNADGGEEQGGEQWLQAEMFAQLFMRSNCRLVVLNCCHGGTVDDDTKGKLGTLGEYLRKARVPAVVVMRHEIADHVAGDFSRAFYQELIAGQRPGRIDLAVQEGRQTLYRTYSDRKGTARAFITPVLYLRSGCEQLFNLDRARERGPGRKGIAAAEIDPRIPKRLLAAIQTRRCLPILGPGILAAGATRREARAPNLGGLVERLGAESEFPLRERIVPLTGSGAEWLTPVLLHRICQHYESVNLKERAGLVHAIRECYRSVEPSPLLQGIADWTIPALVYTHVDGLLEQCLRSRKGRNLRVVGAEDLQEGSQAKEDDLVMLNLRGSYAEERSLVLTEADEDSILDRMTVVASFVENLMTSVSGCSLLFLGVPPRDPLVRALARRLLRAEVQKSRGTAFFIAESSSEADTAYWKQFPRVEWREVDVETVLAGLTAAVQASRSATP